MSGNHDVPIGDASASQPKKSHNRKRNKNRHTSSNVNKDNGISEQGASESATNSQMTSHNETGHMGKAPRCRNKSKNMAKDSPSNATPPAPKGPGSASSVNRSYNACRSGTPSNSAKKQQKYSKKTFDAYWSKEDVQRGLKQGTLIEGSVRINPKNYEDAYVPHPDMKSDVYIAGILARNRALNADIVVLQMLPKDEWKVLVDDLTATCDGDKQIDDITKSTVKLSVEETPPASARSAALTTPKQCQAVKHDFVGSSGQRKHDSVGSSGQRNTRGTPKKQNPSVREFLESETADVRTSPVARRLFGSSEAGGVTSRVDAIPDKCLLRTGQVVYIVEKNHNRACTGHIKPMQDGNTNVALFSPLDHRVPRIQVPMSECPDGFLQRANDFKNTLYIARITEWEHPGYAKGTLARSLGEAGEIEPETEGILTENGVDYEEFPQEALNDLPKNLPWSIPSEEYTRRRDLRSKCIFTIDPATARDLDDAVSCESLGNGEYEVGVHIADVSYFLSPDTCLNTIAGRRATSVYLVQKVVPMLPRLLCEELCSLNPDVDRLTFSVIWKITERGEILGEWFGRSVIRSCAKLSYSHAQGFIEEPTREWGKEELPAISEGFTAIHIRDRVLNLNKIAVNIRTRRFDEGALRLNQVKIQFALDRESGLPSGYSVYKQRESNMLIEEFMLLANMAVAHRIHKSFPDLAVLRRHPPPQEKMIDNLIKTCNGLGIPIRADTAGELQRSLSVYEDCSDEMQAAKLQILTVLCSKPMQNARYFCSGSISDETEFCHYALNVPLYTHFTSPIRRFADVMVHRLLAAALGCTESSGLTEESAKRQCIQCNMKKQCAKRVSDLSNDLFFAVFVKECGPLEETGMVMEVLDRSFDVVMLRLGVVKRVYCEKLPLVDHSFAKATNPVLTLNWATDATHPQVVSQPISIFSVVTCVLKSDGQPLKWTAIIKHPNDTEADS